jgi:hypothetical protein
MTANELEVGYPKFRAGCPCTPACSVLAELDFLSCDLCRHSEHPLNGVYLLSTNASHMANSQLQNRSFKVTTNDGPLCLPSQRGS